MPVPIRPLAVPAALLLAAAAPAQSQFMPSQARSHTSFLPEQPVPLGSMAIADVDGDGAADVLAAGEPHALFLRRGSGWSVQQLALGPRDQYPQLRDLDGDGDAELIFGPGEGRTTAPLVMLRNDGGGTFATVTLPPELAVPLQGVAAGDVDGDGDADLVVSAPPPTPSIRLFRNQGGLAFAHDGAAVPAALPYGCWPVLADFDGDGDLDVLASVLAQPSVFLRNDGSGRFTDARAALPTGWVAHVWGAAGDLDGDGLADAVQVRWNGDIDVLWSTGGGFAGQAGLVAGPASTRAVPADVDGDGDLDLLSRRADGLDLVRNLGGRRFAREMLLDGAEAGGGLGTGDLNGDGLADAIVTTAFSLRSRAYWGTPAGLLGDLADGGFRTLAAPHEHRQAPFAGDVDGDGRVDVLLPSARGLIVQHALGGGRYRATLSPQPLAGGRVERPLLADLDGDGDLDLLLGSADPLRAYGNDGTGAFAAWFTLAGSTAEGDAVQVGDVDGDGDPDIVRLAPGGPALYRNTGGVWISH